MTSRTTAIIYAVIVALLFATHTVFSRMLLGTVDPLAYAGLRGLGAGLILGLVHARPMLERLNYPLIPKAMIVATFGYGLNQVLLIEGLIRAGSADAALINGTIPLVTAMATAVLNLERLGKMRLIGVLLGLIGLSGFTIAVQRTNLRFDLLGDLFLLGNVLAFGLALALLRLLTRSVPSGVAAALMLSLIHI